MLWRKIIVFSNTDDTQGAWLYKHFGLNDGERARANRLDQTSSPDTFVENEAGLKCALEDIVIAGHKQISFIRVALNGLGTFNSVLGHDGADAVLQAVIANIRHKMPSGTDARYFRSGSDWVFVFDGKNAEEIQKQAAAWLVDEKNWITDPQIQQPCALSVLAMTAPIAKETLGAVYQVINALRPGKNTVAESLKDIKSIILPDDMTLLQIKSPGKTINNITFFSEEYPGIPKEYIPALLQEEDAAALQKTFAAGALYEAEFQNQWGAITTYLTQGKDIADKSQITLIDAEQYMREYRVEERYVFMKDANTMIVPATNIFGEVMFALELHLREPIADWNNEALRIKHSSNSHPTYRVREDNPVLKSFRYPPLNHAMDTLMYLRRFDSALALMEPTGRTMFFGRTVTPYLDYLMRLSQDELEAIPDDSNESLEMRMVARILLRDGYVLLRNGGEEFFVLARDKQNHWFGMAYDYNKFSRFGTTFGEGASDLYMQRSAGLLRTEISSILTAHYAAGKPYSAKYLADVLQAAVERLNNREIRYAVPQDILQRPIRTKSGKLVYAVHISGQWYLFAGGDSQNNSNEVLQAAIKKSGLAKRPESIAEYLRCAERLGPLTPETVITVINRNNTTIRKNGDTIEVDLNKIIGVNPKAVFTDEPLQTETVPLHPGVLLQGLLSGLSLAGSVIAWDVRASLRELIVIADTLAERAKAKANEKSISTSGQQETLVDFRGKMTWQNQSTVALTFGVQ